MEPNKSLALHTRQKRERTPNLDNAHDSPDSKRQAGDMSGIVRAPVEFPWKECEDLEDVERLKIKEQAVVQAERYCERIRAVLEPVLSTANDRTESIMLGLNIVKQWCAEYGKSPEIVFCIVSIG